MGKKIIIHVLGQKIQECLVESHYVFSFLEKCFACPLYTSNLLFPKILIIAKKLLHLAIIAHI